MLHKSKPLFCPKCKRPLDRKVPLVDDFFYKAIVCTNLYCTFRLNIINGGKQ